MGRGRPVRSTIRENMVEVLFALEEAYGYQIYKIYKKLFPAITLRSIYYHLRKGMELEEFEKVRIDKDSGEFSWGPSAERIVYKLGPRAKPRGNQRVLELVHGISD